MDLRKKIKEITTGLTLGQEYICLAKDQLTDPLKVMLSSAGQSPAIDVTSTHLFLGYRPVIIGLYSDGLSEEYSVLCSRGELRLDFLPAGFEGDSDVNERKGSVAHLLLRKSHEKVIGSGKLFLFQATRGSHQFLNPLHRLAGNVREQIRKKQSGNVRLPGNLYDQVRIAYATPRMISIVTVVQGERMNMFPTDLHGPLGAAHYAGSLRIGGMANEQVEQSRRIVVSEVEAPWYRQAYSLGKNHMKPMRESLNFPRLAGLSERFHFPLPESVIGYRELHQTDFLDIGIHRIHFYEVIQRKTTDASSALTHIHQYYAQWRIDRGLSTPWLIR